MRRLLAALGLAALLAGCGRTPAPVVPADEIPAVEVVEQAQPEIADKPAPHPALFPRTAAPPPTDDPPAPLPAAAPGELELRVGLATDLDRIALPCCRGRLVARAAGRELELESRFSVRPAAGAAGAGHFRLQVAALKDETQARALAARLGRRLGLPADARFDAGAGLYKVRLGRFVSREQAEGQDRGLEAAGIAGAWVVSEGGGLEDPALVVEAGGASHRFEGRWLAIEPLAAGEGSAVAAADGRLYRGRLLIFLNDRGRLNLINELSLEDYLRGVVPKEMGPLVYPQPDALKAQAVAARTYTVRHLGEFAAEGYDLCATPRCHVYGGVEAEHPATDRALAETAGEVVRYAGEPADTLYTATCGGHTEDVERIFPSLTGRPYLRGVRCSEAGAQELAGGIDRGTPFPSGFTRALLPADPGGSAVAELEQRLAGLARLAGLPAVGDRLASLERREVRRFVASLFDLVLDPRLFAARERLPQLLHAPPAEWGDEALRQAAYLVASGLFDGEAESSLDPAATERLLLELAVLVHVVREEPASFQRLANGEVEVRQRGEMRRYALPADLPGFRRRGESTAASSLRLVSGDRLRLYLRGDELVALVHEMDPDSTAFDRRKQRRAWTRFHTDAELAALVAERYPGLGFERFDVVERGPSGRVTKIVLTGSGGRRVEVEGLAVRWTLGVPETLFTAQRLSPSDGPAGWLFRGRGWGHGVGMCQEGAYGMALRGHGYRQILAHYYTGTDVGPLDPSTLPTAATLAAAR